MLNIIKSSSFILFVLIMSSCDENDRSPSDLIDREFKTEYCFVNAGSDPAQPGDVVLIDLEYKNQPFLTSINEQNFDSDTRGKDRVPFSVPVGDNFNFRFDTNEDAIFRLLNPDGSTIFELNPGTTNSITLAQGDYLIELENNVEFVGGEGADTLFIPFYVQPDLQSAEQADAKATDDYRPQDKFILIKSNSCVKCDFGDTDSLTTINLDMSNSDLRGSYYKNTTFETVNFAGSNMSYVELIESNGRLLGETNMANAKFLTCNFNDVDLSYAYDLSHVDFYNCSMDRVNLEGSYGIFISFEGSVMRWANMTKMFTRENIFNGGNYQSASFTSSVFYKSEFNYAAFRETVFDLSDVSNSLIENSVFTKTSFKGTNLCGVAVISPRKTPDFEPVVFDSTTLCPESATIINLE